MRGGHDRIIVSSAPEFMNNYGRIMTTAVQLPAFAAARGRSVESLMSILAPEDSRDRLRTRDRITEGLQKEEAGVSLQDLHLERFANQAEENDEVRGVLYRLIKFAVDKFVHDYPDLAETIEGDDAYKHGTWDNDVAIYIAQAVCETLGIL